MSFEYYIRSGTRLLRCGFTTGTCAALAAAGAAELLLAGKAPDTLRLLTPKGLVVEVPPEEVRMEGDAAVCAVRKDGGDDPDVTDGLLVFARVARRDRGVTIDGGEGVGRVTKPGLDQPVGAAAINSVPRRMIAAAVEEVCGEQGYDGGLAVVISLPGGAEIARKTFNPHLGVEGGLSVLGTSGIVEPMSERAVVDTITVEIRQVASMGARRLILTPGNYGMEFLRRNGQVLGPIPRVKCSNYIGDAIDAAALEGFGEVLLVGHIGKLVKLAGGVMNTHSRTADVRRELFCAYAALSGAGRDVCRALMEQATADGCIAVLDEAGLRAPVMAGILAAAQEHLERRAGGAMTVGAVIFSNTYGTLGATPAAERLLREWGAEL